MISDSALEHFRKVLPDQLLLIDEVLTPDSSRFWPADHYVIGQSPPSFDKQFVRDYLETLDWNKTPPGPKLPGDVVARWASEEFMVLFNGTPNIAEMRRAQVVPWIAGRYPSERGDAVEIRIEGRVITPAAIER